MLVIEKFTSALDKPSRDILSQVSNRNSSDRDYNLAFRFYMDGYGDLASSTCVRFDARS